MEVSFGAVGKNKGHWFKLKGDLPHTGQKVRSIPDFFDAVVKNTIVNSIKVLEKTSWPPYGFLERAMHSVLAPAIFSASDWALLEYPTSRETANDERRGSGWIDYLAQYNGASFIIELKKEFLSARKKLYVQKRSRTYSRRKLFISKYVKSLWGEANAQCRNTGDIVDSFHPCWPVAMMALTVYETVSGEGAKANQPRYEPSDQELIDTAKEILLGGLTEDETNKPNLVYCWKPPQSQREKGWPLEVDEKEPPQFRLYSAVFFIFRIHAQ